MSIVDQGDAYSAAAYDPTFMLTRIGGDMQLFAELVEMFLEEYPPLVDQIRLAIAENDANRLKQAAHSLRGAIGNFTVDKPYECAKQLESMAQIDNLTNAQNALDSLAAAVAQLASALKRSVPCSDS